MYLDVSDGSGQGKPVIVGAVPARVTVGSQGRRAARLARRGKLDKRRSTEDDSGLDGPTPLDPGRDHQCDGSQREDGHDEPFKAAVAAVRIPAGDCLDPFARDHSDEGEHAAGGRERAFAPEPAPGRGLP